MTKGKSKDVQEDMKPSASAAASESKAIPTDFEPPVACIQRVIKSVLPESVQIGKDAKAAFARSAGIFIMYITACANDFAKDNKRSTITAGDVLAVSSTALMLLCPGPVTYCICLLTGHQRA
jgi:histone H3/H4